MSPSARRDSLQLSLSDEDSEDEFEDLAEGQVDASWLSDNQGSANSRGVDADTTASTDTARHDTEEYVEQIETEEDDLNLFSDQGLEENEDRATGADIEEGEWARLSAKQPPTALLQRAGLSPKQHQKVFANEWAELVHVSDEDDEKYEEDSLNNDVEASGLSVRLKDRQGNLALTSSVAFESLFIEEDDGSSSAASTVVIESEAEDQKGEHSRTHSSMDLDDFVNKYGDLSGSTPSPLSRAGLEGEGAKAAVYLTTRPFRRWRHLWLLKGSLSPRPRQRQMQRQRQRQRLRQNPPLPAQIPIRRHSAVSTGTVGLS